MVKIQTVLLTLLLAGCTSDHYRFFSRSLGFHKVVHVFPIDLSNYKKQIFRINGVEIPSVLGRRFDGWTRYNLELCFDSIPGVGLHYTKGLDIKTNVSIEGYSKDFPHFGGQASSDCWKVDYSDGFHILSNSFPAETDLDKPLIIEFQIMEPDSSGWSYFVWGDNPDLEFHIEKGDSLALNALKNPRLVFWTGGD